jgi:two-component system NarL family sensor kinase
MNQSSDPTPHSLSDAEQLRQRNRELSILNTFAEALNQSVDLKQTLETALAKAREVFDLHTGWVWLLEEHSPETYLAAAQNLPPGLARQPELMQGSCYCLDTYRAGDLDGAANVNVIACSRLKKLVDGTDGLRYHASVPLYAHGRQLGVLNLASADWRELTPDDLRLLYTMGDMLSIAIERARLFARSAEIGALEERNRLAREIHDTLAQRLAGITLQLESAEAVLEAGGNPDRLHRAISQALEQARTSLEEARRSVLDLRATPLEGRTLYQALPLLVNAASEEYGLAVEYRMDGDEIPLPARIEAGLYRIAQEALANVAQHAGVGYASLHLEIMPNRVRLEITDQGQGFDPALIPSGRFGLQGMNERARLMGGELQIVSAPGRGTRVVVSVPFALTDARGM